MPNINFLRIIKKYSIANRGRFNDSNNPILKANTLPYKLPKNKAHFL